MGVNSLPETVTRQRRGCDLNPGPFATESSTLTTRLPSYPHMRSRVYVTVLASVRQQTRWTPGLLLSVLQAIDIH